ncbi:substrate-binding domain-containing protein [Promicromonospora xylanilytica]
MQKRATTRLVAVALAVGLTATACSAPTDTGDGDTITIGFSQRRLAGSDWWATLLAGAKDRAAELGAEVVVTDAGGDAVKQNSDVQTLITKGADAVILNPQDPTGVAPAVNATTQAGIPLVVVNSNLSDELAQQQFCYVAEDQPAVAAEMGAAIGELAKERFADESSVKAVVIGGYSGETITEQRGQGVVDGYASVQGAPPVEYLPIRYGEWLPDRALQPMRDIATAHPDLDIVFALSDVMLPGIEQGLKDAGILDHVVIGTYDGQMAVIKRLIDDPDGPVQVDASNEPYKQGQVAVEKAVAAAQGKSQDDECPGGEYFIDTFLATPANADKFYDPSRTF